MYIFIVVGLTIGFLILNIKTKKNKTPKKEKMKEKDICVKKLVFKKMTRDILQIIGITIIVIIVALGLEYLGYLSSGVFEASGETEKWCVGFFIGLIYGLILLFIIVGVCFATEKIQKWYKNIKDKAEREVRYKYN